MRLGTLNYAARRLSPNENAHGGLLPLFPGLTEEGEKELHSGRSPVSAERGEKVRPLLEFHTVVLPFPKGPNQRGPGQEIHSLAGKLPFFVLMVFFLFIGALVSALCSLNFDAVTL